MAFYVYEPIMSVPVSAPRRKFRRQLDFFDDFMFENPRNSNNLGKTLALLDSLAEVLVNKNTEESKKTEVESTQKNSEAAQKTTNSEIPAQNAVVQNSNEVEKEAPKMVQKATKVGVNEDLNKIEINVEFIGHKFKPEDLEVQVVDGNVLLIKAGDKFERQFQLSTKCKIDKIESIFNCKEEQKQTLIVKIPKEVNIVQVPISMEE